MSEIFAQSLIGPLASLEVNGPIRLDGMSTGH